MKRLPIVLSVTALFVAILATGLLTNTSSSHAQPATDRMYWADAATRKIQRANLDGTGVVDLVVTGPVPEGIALDQVHSKVYWSESNSNKIRRANLDGTGVEDLVGSVGSATLDLDVAGGKMYWADRLVTGKIQRANLDGTGVEELVTFVSDRAGIALDVTGGKLYWTNRSFGWIRRANLDDTGIENLITGLSDPRQIALDLTGGKMYWADAATGKIQRANLDGSGVEDIVTNLAAPRGVALDVDDDKMYWTEFGTGTIRRANLGGTGVEVLVEGLSLPAEIALELQQATIPVDIDIKPRRDRNSINCRNAKRVIPVAIFTTDDFDATTVDLTTVTFEGASETHVNKKTGKPRRHQKDVDDDGDTDLAFHFRLRHTDLTCDSTEGTLTGETFDGQPIEGTDTVRMVSPGKRY